MDFLNEANRLHDLLAQVVELNKRQEYDEALRLGLGEERRPCAFAPLLVALATAGQLGDPRSSDFPSLQDVQDMLCAATRLEAEGGWAAYEYAEFLDCVMDDPKGALAVLAEATERRERELGDLYESRNRILKALGRFDEASQLPEEVGRRILASRTKPAKADGSA